MNDPEFRQRLRATFQGEAAEHLRALSQDAFALERATAAEHSAIIERVFRETHTLKGAARMVGEMEAEALCHALEQRLSGWKHRARPLAPEEVAELHREVADLARVLNLPLAPALPETPIPADPVASAVTAAPEAAKPAAPTAIVRVPGARLDALLTRAEEMVSAKLTGDQHAAHLSGLSERGLAWKRELERVRPELAALRRLADTPASAPLLKELGAVLHYLDWTHEFLRELQGDLTKLAGRARQEQRRLGTMVEQLLDETKEVLMLPFSSLLETFPTFVREAAQERGKAIALELRGEETEIDRRVLEEIKDALLHLVRNSIDHGIELPEQRRAAGKPERGRITITVQDRSGGNVEITVADDGRGIAAAEVTAHARRLGLLPKEAPELPEHEALALLFRSGFSTRAQATDLSGRGLGLAIVREKAELIGGTVSVESEPGGGTSFRVQVPLTLARFRGLFVQAQRQTFALPTAYVRRVVRGREADVRRVKHQELVELEGRTFVVVSLATSLGLAAPVRDPAGSGHVFLVVLESNRSRVALRVDDVPYEHEVVLKSLGPMLRRAPQYVGATIVGGGQIVPVLNVNHILGTALGAGRGGAEPRAPRPQTTGSRKRTVLVAEDSITSRSLLKGILQSAGYEVRTAVDGADALTILKFEPVDLVISDVQMPRLNGFELTAKIRADAGLSTLPVILITSLASREDKERGVDAGANAYIVKSSFDQSDLLAAIGRLIP